VVAILMLLRFVHDPPYIKNAKPGGIDGIGLGLLALWLGALQIVLDKGQEADWFGAVWIRWATFVGAVTLLAFILRELKAAKPLVDLQVFRNRNFAMGCLLMAMFGGSIYGLITLLPLFYQTLLGYSATAAGWAVSPRGIGAICIMPVIGLLTARMDNRWLIIAGFLFFGFTSFWMGELTLDIGPSSLLWPVIISGMGSGMVFVPLSTISMGMLRNEQMGNAAGLFNLMRNVGGGIGISIVNALVVRHGQIHRAMLAQNLAAGNPAFQQTFNTTSSRLAATASQNVAAARAYGVVQNVLDRQASAFSYADVFRDLTVACVLCAGVVLFMKRVRPKKGAAIPAH
jgi:MFS transporter, DHA2 family, multidrug resistance protein